MDQAHGAFNKYYTEADTLLARLPIAQKFQEKTGVSKVYGASGIAGVGLLLVFLNIGASLLVNLTGFGYAAYASMEAIETPGKEDDAQWLTYWVVFGLFNVLEYFTGFLLYWFPFYYLIKLGFLVWLMAPATRGAERLYHSGLKPLMLQACNSQRSVPANKAAEAKSD
ncbi:ER membrane protein DP1/Yop1 [Coemansia sp. RSA 1807]|nr:ER membrane protein DP1/Yop1 [Coemansia sp. RSA 1591]KAJ1755934.1 ER membrane protein DP1/Yop1 [Coemansia sp. RSA 1752]KAJ1793517.1 ER membrane protein DP1/Yop1 [Coemansia sp. RSA 2167]KAJ2143435.1 ER membrane protein DP1/Yop1 [Coemansia sp. RSA 564]KAJ2154408.1 ER membrane protein DP1/Yop1 [Coemansia sp. RSA 637]KAJ2284191.1 ER membrane protein DP1/Yop1 [Coemansia sp. RSA 370]KAJ2300892.1 ER membrane protein DP1/Yop1 [Coemansia sp. RSA 353]KAJ2406052.1 ER membrane protein DP1/Yop1 [Coema